MTSDIKTTWTLTRVDYEGDRDPLFMAEYTNHVRMHCDQDGSEKEIIGYAQVPGDVDIASTSCNDFDAFRKQAEAASDRVDWIGDEVLADYDRVEQEIGEWAEANFGADQPDWYPLVGAVEEIGEIASCYSVTKAGRMSALLELISLFGDLSHSILKDAQGIRGDEDGVGKRAENRAISDIHHTLSRLEDYESVGVAELRPSLYEEVVDGVGDAHLYLGDFNYRNATPMSLGESVAYAWYGEVQGREWDADVTVDDGGFANVD